MITEQDKINGLQVGEDGYNTKPFSLQELTARPAMKSQVESRKKLLLNGWMMNRNY